jgi:hypothetical protein
MNVISFHEHGLPTNAELVHVQIFELYAAKVVSLLS